jgi:MYXO-CTERM domain-containing protein
VQTMTLRGNVIIESASQANQGQIWAVYNDEASGSPVSFSVTALYNTVVGDGAHTAFIHLSNADSTVMSAKVDDNIIAGTSQPILVEDGAHATVTGKNNWLQTGAAASGLTGTLSGTAPGFSSSSNDDFTLAPGSKCVGAADTSVGGLPADEYYLSETITRMYRVRASAMDVGAFEHTTMGIPTGPYGPASPSDAGAGDASIAVAADAGTQGDAAMVSNPSSDAGQGDETSTPRGSSSGGVDASSDGSASGSSSGGCGCRMASDAQPGGIGSLSVAAVGAVIARARRRRLKPSTRRRAGTPDRPRTSR